LPITGCTFYRLKLNLEPVLGRFFDLSDLQTGANPKAVNRDLAG
jgi:hypothetical protein